jgi:hypothetical protein
LEEVDVNGLLDHSTPSALSEVLRNETQGRIRRALASLPQKHRVVLVLRYYNRMSYSQVADALNLPLSAVRVRIFRAKRSLRCSLHRSNRADTFARLGPEQRLRGKAELTSFRISGATTDGHSECLTATTSGHSECLTATTSGHSDRSRPTPFPLVRPRTSRPAKWRNLSSIVAPLSTPC